MRVNHSCHADGCEVEIPPALFMCFDHWGLVPARLKRRIKKLYRPGQEVEKNPSVEYLNTAREAIQWVARHERDEALAFEDTLRIEAEEEALP